jgi:hypothetical protein
MRRFAAAAAVVVAAGAAAAAMGQLAERPLAGALKHPAIGYYTTPTHDLVAGLDRRIEEGALHLDFDEASGYLRPMLDALHLSVESQMLVMSKTGVQGLHTGPANPRAIFFNDTVTVGYIRGAPLLELAVQDPEQGVIFYTLDQKPQARPLFERRPACLSCHQAYSTLHVPGLLARSVFMAPDGLPLTQFGSYDADDRTPFRRRWGGWYVTGTEKRDTVVSDSTLHRLPLERPFDTRSYASTHSDIAALMVFQHQGRMTNLITRVGWEWRIAAYERRINPGEAPLKDAVDELVDYLLFVDEEPLTAAIRGTSGFAEAFSAQGPTDRRGRSLRQLDLDHRLLRYPCSYMIYSTAFRALPDEARSAIYRRIWEVLSAREPGPRYARLSADDRRAVLEILQETLPDLPPVFHVSAGGADARGGVFHSPSAESLPTVAATFTNASTTAGSKCVPRSETMNATASACDMGSR